MAEFSETEQTEDKVQEVIEDKVQEVINEPQPVEIDRVGAILYKERAKKNIDLHEVSQKLCIRQCYLEAIEKGEYGSLPPMPYSMGFVDSYAKYLGLNNVRIAQLFKEELDIKPQIVRNIETDDAVTEARLPRREYVLIGVFAIILIAWLWRSLASPDDIVANKTANTTEDVFVQEDVEYYPTADNVDTKTSENQDEEIPLEQKGVNKDDSKNVEKIAEPVENSSNTLEPEAKSSVFRGVEVKIKEEDTWLEVKDANKVYISRIMKAGETYQLPQVEGLILSAGKYSTVDIYVNGKLTPLLKKERKTNINIDNALNNNN